MTTNREILTKIKRAERLAREASRAAVEADALVSTFWTPTDLMPPPFWLTQSLRDAAGHTLGLANQLTMYAHTHLKNRKPKP